MFESLFTSARNQKLLQKQHEAILKILALISQLDGKVKLSEQQLLDDYLAHIPWHSELTKEEALGVIIAEVRQLLDKGHEQEYLAKQAKLVDNTFLKFELLNIVEKMILADFDIDSKEKMALNTLKEALTVS